MPARRACRPDRGICRQKLGDVNVAKRFLFRKLEVERERERYIFVFRVDI